MPTRKYLMIQEINKLSNSIYNFFDDLIQKIKCYITSYIIVNLIKIIGIKIGKNNKFYAFAKFKKANSASISIGSYNSFRSGHTSNLIGINRPCIVSALDKNAKIIIGNNCGFSGTVIGSFDNIIIGDNVKCGANTLITDGDWHGDDYRSGAPRPIKIGNNVWLGVNVTILKGVEIGENTLIGANSTVVKSIPANCIAVGNPCKVITNLKI